MQYNCTLKLNYFSITGNFIIKKMFAKSPFHRGCNNPVVIVTVWSAYCGSPGSSWIHAGRAGALQIRRCSVKNRDIRSEKVDTTNQQQCKYHSRSSSVCVFSSLLRVWTMNSYGLVGSYGANPVSILWR